MTENVRHSFLRDLNRGGQTFIHDVRMQKQTLLLLIMASLFFFALSVALLFYWQSTPELRRDLVKIAEAKYYEHLVPHKKITLDKDHAVESQWLLKQAVTQRILLHGKSLLFKGIATSWVVTALFWLSGLTWLWLRGRKVTKAELVKGTVLIAPKKLKRRLKKLGVASDLEIGGVPLIKGSETTHLLIHGTVGTGKSVCMKSLMDQIRRRGNKAVIYDKHGDYVKYFFREGKDILLNPLDARCAQWDLWRECPHPANFDTLAAGLIPLTQSASDPFWVNAARTIFSSAAYKLQSDPEKSTDKLLEYLLMSNLESIADLLKGTEAETLVSDKIAKTALSVKTVLATYLSSLKYLPEVNEHAFSIREWVQDETSDSWLFITSRADMHETLKPLISAWLDIATNALMSLPEDRERRFWVMLDEVASLQRLPTLSHSLAESRKFGGCFALALQNFAQLKKLYGNNGAEEISDLCNTRVYFRSPSTESARWVSKELGQNEWLEANEGLSYGANTHRDGVSLSRQQHYRPVVTESEIKSLENLSAYLKLPPVSTKKNKCISIVNIKFSTGYSMEYSKQKKIILIEPYRKQTKQTHKVERKINVKHLIDDLW